MKIKGEKISCLLNNRIILLKNYSDEKIKKNINFKL